jgi:GNAT superfamily N-acetyltransferase
MSDPLGKVEFTEAHLALPKVQAFDCGDEEWEREVANWLKAPKGQNGAVDDLARGTKVWLYVTAAGELVGVGSLGMARLRWPKGKSDPIPASVIPNLGIDRAHRGRGYGGTILSDLLAAALAVASERRLLVLYVHEQNPALTFYLKYNFAEYGKPYLNPDNNRHYKRLVLDLAPTPLG